MAGGLLHGFHYSGKTAELAELAGLAWLAGLARLARLAAVRTTVERLGLRHPTLNA